MWHRSTYSEPNVTLVLCAGGAVSERVVVQPRTGHNADVRRSAWPVVLGAVIVAAAVIAAQATYQWREFGCGGVGGFPACGPAPGVWHWNDVNPMFVGIGAVVGAALAVSLRVLARRQRDRRRSWGE